MWEYVFPVICIILFAITCYLLINAVTPKSNMKIEIIIDATDEEQAEKTVMLAKMLSDKHFNNADIYIRGADNDYIETLCRKYNINRSEL